jgi:lipopolysaccharide export system protein LptC
MTADAAFAAQPRRTDFERWRRRSRLIRLLRVLLPVTIGLIFLGLAGSVAWSTFRAQPETAQRGDEPIRLVNPRFVGRDDKGRAFVLTADAATRDIKDYQRVILERPALVLDEGGPDQMRLAGKSGVFHEATGKLQLDGGVRMADAKNAFETAASEFDTQTGEIVGSGAIQGSGGLGQITAGSYSVHDKGDRMVFKGGVHTRLEGK